MNWDHPYLTMNFSYEAKELEALGEFVQKGYITRSNKTVPWCSSCETVLATAEIEYEDRKDPSIYVAFPLTSSAKKNLFPKINGEIAVAVWTTTPWTLPLNRAVLVKPETAYVLLELPDSQILIGKDLADAFCTMLGVEKKVIKEITAEQLAGIELEHPFINNLVVPIIADDSVLTDEGTAFVHCAPGAGPQDYETGVKNNLEIFSPVSPQGRYTDQVKPVALAGMPVKDEKQPIDGQRWVMKTLVENGRMLHKTSIKHSYPHCWRCRNGLIFRATKQWFFSLTHEDLKERTIKATESIATLPEKSINRLQATIENRFEWCISRQRTWGVPIPALLCTTCDATYITKEFVDKVAQGVAKEGIEFWQHVAISALVGNHFACSVCKGTSFTKEKDILDVWFDSGLSHYAVLLHNPELGYPADLYLEGKDQHRGWFQSSLLTSVALEGDPAMKMIITHGFTVDDKGRKMSKSLGNVVAPQELIDKIGTDGLRLWASSIDFSSEAIVSDKLLNNVQEVFRKVRNTCRFLLSNLYDFDIDTDAIPLEEMRIIDQYALQELFEFNYAMMQSYADYDFTALFHRFGDYCSVNLSTFYFEIVKDCLYVEKADGHARRSVQTACWYILDALTKLMAPIFSFTAEQVSDLYQKDKKESIHLQHFNFLADIGNYFAQYDKALYEPIQRVEGLKVNIFDTVNKINALAMATQQERLWNTLKAIRSAILKATEELRAKEIIKRSLDARVTIFIDPKADFAKDIETFFELLKKHGETPETFFKDFAILSQFALAKNKEELSASLLPGLFITAEKARGAKCPRCWQWTESKNKYDLCDRCAVIVS
jgi:isoleucyl-tRNA synthetase